MSMYVVTMHKWGQRNSHNYAIGAWPSLGMAMMRGEIEADNRGGKYEYRVTRTKSGNRGEFRREMFRPRIGCPSRFMLKLALNRSMAWYKSGDVSRFGAL